MEYVTVPVPPDKPTVMLPSLPAQVGLVWAVTVAIALQSATQLLPTTAFARKSQPLAATTRTWCGPEAKPVNTLLPPPAGLSTPSTKYWYGPAVPVTLVTVICPSFELQPLSETVTVSTLKMPPMGAKICVKSMIQPDASFRNTV